MGIFFNDRSFEYETMRALTYANYQGASLSEVVEVSKQIKVGDFTSWYENWHNMASKIADYADTLRNNNHDKSAIEFYLRASNYFRTAEFFLTDYESRRISCYEKSVKTFRLAMSLMDINCEIVNIPYEDYFMNGYVYFHDEKAPTLIFIGGYDSTVEELFFAGGFSAFNQGYNVLIFDGPGQGGVLRMQKKVAQYDFEKPLSAAIDFLEENNNIKSDNFIGLIGMSLGGYYASRAVAFEKRISGCILFDVFTSVWDSIANKTPHLLSDLSSYGTKDSYDRWMLKNGLWVFGAENIIELKEKVSKFDVLPIANKIDCPMLLQYGTEDIFVSEDQLYSLENVLNCDYTTYIFDNTFGGQEHCRVGNISLATQAMFDWLNTCIRGGN